MQQLQTYRSRPDGECGLRNLTSGKHTPNEQSSNVTFSASRIVHTISHKTGKRMCGSKNRTFSLPCRVACPTKCKRECVARRTTHSLCHPVAYHFPQNARENVRFFELHILSLPVANPKVSEKRQGEHEVLRTLHSLFLSCNPSPLDIICF